MSISAIGHWSGIYLVSKQESYRTQYFHIRLLVLSYRICWDKNAVMKLFYADNTEGVLGWHQRHAIAIGIAKGLRFLHEECRGSPILHRDMRPSNIFLTHEYVPLVNHYRFHIYPMPSYL